MIRRVILSACLFLWPTLIGAHTEGLVEMTCPICGAKFEAELDLSGTQFGVRLDLKPLGPIEAPPRLAVCPECNFVLYTDDVTAEERDKIRDFLQSDKYKRLVKEKHTSYFLLASILTHMGSGDFTVGYAYLKASWQIENRAPQRHRAYLESCLTSLQTFIRKTEDRSDNWKTAQVLIGEIFRRLSRFEEAEEHFEGLAEMPEFTEQPFRTIREYELELIEKQDHGPRPLPAVELTPDDIRKTPAFKMLEASPTLSPFTDLFEISELRAKEGCTLGVYFSGDQEWSGHFVPKKELACNAMAELIFQVGINDVVRAGLAPQQILDALREACSTASAAQLLKDAGRVRLRAAGDRLHWDTQEVEGYRSILQQNGIETPPTKDWMRVIFDLRDKKMIGLYHAKASTVSVVDFGLFNNPQWREQYETLTGRKLGADDEFPSDQFCPLVDSEGNLRLLPKREAADR